TAEEMVCAWSRAGAHAISAPSARSARQHLLFVGCHPEGIIDIGASYRATRLHTSSRHEQTLNSLTPCRLAIPRSPRCYRSETSPVTWTTTAGDALRPDVGRAEIGPTRPPLGPRS